MKVKAKLKPSPKRETLGRQAARFVWAILLARIDEIFPLICPKCGGMMKIIAFMARGHPVGEPVDPSRIAPALGTPLWEAAGQDGDNPADPASARVPVRSALCLMTW